MKTNEAAAAGGMAEPLTPRETEVLRLTCEGLSIKEICRKLTISAHTAKDHRTGARVKLGARNQAQAIYKAVKAGLA